MKNWCAMRGSNSRHSPSQSDTLPAELIAHEVTLFGGERGIRTLGPVTVGKLATCSLKPLGHLSKFTFYYDFLYGGRTHK